MMEFEQSASDPRRLFKSSFQLNEEEKFEIFYAKEADQVRFVSEFKMGVNVAFPDEIVKFILA